MVSYGLSAFAIGGLLGMSSPIKTTSQDLYNDEDAPQTVRGQRYIWLRPAPILTQTSAQQPLPTITTTPDQVDENQLSLMPASNVSSSDIYIDDTYNARLPYYRYIEINGRFVPDLRTASRAGQLLSAPTNFNHIAGSWRIANSTRHRTDQFLDSQTMLREKLSRILNINKILNASLATLHALILVRIVTNKLLFNLYLPSLSMLQSNLKLDDFVIMLASILDFANSCLWHKCRHSFHKLNDGNFKQTRSYFSSTLSEGGLARSMIILTFSPRHVFSLINTIFCLKAPYSKQLASLILTHYSLNSSIQHVYNLYRVTKYQVYLGKNFNKFIFRQQFFANLTANRHQSLDNNNNNAIRSTDIYDDDSYNITNNSLNVNSTARHIQTSPIPTTNINTLDSLVSSESSIVNHMKSGKRCKHYIYDNPGWSHWPIQLYSCDCDFRDSLSYNFEKTLIISQLLVIKMGVVNICLRLERLSIIPVLLKNITLVCLFVMFLAMYSTYDKIHDRYLHKTSRISRATN